MALPPRAGRRAACSLYALLVHGAMRLGAMGADPSAGGNTVTARGVACVAWDENDFGIPEDSNRCAQVDDLAKPWCFIGDEDWDYCDAAAPPRCNMATNGKKCAPWGGNIWGLDEKSDECFTADGEDDPWCYLVEADGLRGSPDDGPFSAWSFCSCTGKGPVRKPKNTFMSGWDEVYAEVDGVKTPMIELGASHSLRSRNFFLSENGQHAGGDRQQWTELSRHGGGKSFIHTRTC